MQRAAHREYLALQGISHDGIVRAEAYSDELLAGPAVVFRHGADWQRLDHRRHLYHRALAPRSVYVEVDGRYPRLTP